MSVEQWSDLLFSEAGQHDAHVWGSVKSVNSDGSYQVQLNTSSTTTRCSAGCTAGVGDRVLVCIMANGRCVAVARLEGEHAEFAKAVLSSFQPSATGEYAFAIENGTASTDTYFSAKRTDTGVHALFGVGKSGKNHGVYSETMGDWMIFSDGTDVGILSGGDINLAPDGNVVAEKGMVLANNQDLYGVATDGELVSLVDLNNDNNIVFGYGGYSSKRGTTRLCGYDLSHYVSNIASPGHYRPYVRRGDSVNVTIYTAGYLTSSKTKVAFFVPFTRPIIGTPTVTVTSRDGFILRQSGYTHDSSSSVAVKPASYEAASAYSNGVRIEATFSTTTNAVNNAPIGIHWSGTITFS